MMTRDYRKLALATLVWSVYLSAAFAQPAAQLEQARRRLVDDVLAPSGINNQRVLQAMRDTQRHEFIAQMHRPNAYFDMALPIGDKQTISSPFIVAYMTQELDPQPTDRVLEIGTGSGYQAAVLSPLVKDVYTIEIVESLGLHAKSVLKRLKYENVHVKVGDGFQGWPEAAPFNKIIVTCSPEDVPQPLVDQLAEGGMMIIPVGERYQQSLCLVRKKGGKLERETLRPTLFVPMTGRAEEKRVVQPDPKNPKIMNGNFEQDAANLKYIPGWYYERQATWEHDKKAPEGYHYVTFRNEQLGNSAHILQGFPIDGRAIREVEVTASVRTKDIIESRKRDEMPGVAISFYDENRKDVGLLYLGPFRGTQDWHEEKIKLRVPLTAREAILRVGLFGSAGTLSVDNVRVKFVGN